MIDVYLFSPNQTNGNFPACLVFIFTVIAHTFLLTVSDICVFFHFFCCIFFTFFIDIFNILMMCATYSFDSRTERLEMIMQIHAVKC